MTLSAAVSPGVHTEPRGPGLSPPWCSWCWALSRRPEAAWRTQGGRTGQCSAAPSPCHHWWDSDLGHSALSREEPWKRALDCLEVIISNYSPHEVITEQQLQIPPWARRKLAYGQPCEILSSFILLPWFPTFIVSSRTSNSADGFTEIRKFRKQEFSFYWIKKH